ncbi:hypothetical protein [Streptomyces sp. NPDC056227]|uniref:hypothetical protein n=1 Tax=Streptomyces sp. NPDC056227 TaxID=3345753 RepID=UPI0035E20134
MRVDPIAAVKKQLSGAGITTEKADIRVDKNDLLVKRTERGRMKTGELDRAVFCSDHGTRVTVDFQKLVEQQGSTAGAS